MNSSVLPTSNRPQKRWSGCLLIVVGLMGILGFEFVLLPVVRRQDPSLEPTQSLTTFWEEKQELIDLGLMVYHDDWYVGLFGDKSWGKKMIQATLARQKPLFEDGPNPSSPLRYLTNHDFPRGTDRADAWGQWWGEHSSQTQEQWILAGFKEHGFNIANPPDKEDWPKLLSLLGATAGPINFPFQTTEEFHPDYLRYNAYRWLRDSGFDPLLYLAEHLHRPMTGDESGGLISYQQQAGGLRLLNPPLPGTLAFAEKDWYGGLGLDGGIHFYLLERPDVRTAVRIGLVFPLLLGLLMIRWRPGMLKAATITGGSSPPRQMKRLWGWILLGVSTLSMAFYWLAILPWLQGKAPDYTPHLSMQGYWEAKQPHLKWGPWWHEDGNVVGAFGGKEWAERLMQWMAAGKKMQSCQNGHWEEALPMITNHEFDFSNSGKAWQEWWKDNHSKTQEEWIQAGFEKLGVEVEMPPTEKDWPQLLALLKTAPAPASAEEKDHARPSQKYHHSFHVRYNAYRWLRDSGFDPVTYILSAGPGGSAELLNGAQQWWDMDQKNMRALFSAPPPGRLAFAPETRWGFVEELIFSSPPAGFLPMFRWTFSGICAALCLAGGWMLRRRPAVSSKNA